MNEPEGDDRNVIFLAGGNLGCLRVATEYN